MPTRIKIKTNLNKANNQLNISIPKRKVPKKILEEMNEKKELYVTFEKKKR